MVVMTDPGTPTSAPTTDPIPGERRLAHPPSDRYRTPEPEAPIRPVSPGRGIAYAAIVGVIGAVTIVVLGGVLTLTGGLFAVAAVIGYATAWALRVGGGSTIGDRRRAYLALALALASVALGQLGLWLYALTEGGVLPLVEYLGEAFGPLVPLQAVIAGVVAWVTAR
jgi:hypothetical protein